MSSSVGSMSDSKVDTVSRLAKWRIKGIGLNTSRRSDAFKIGIWNWYLYVEKNKYMYIRLYPEPCRVSKELPVAKFVIRVSIPDPGRRTFISPVSEKLLRSIEDFVWPIEGTIEGNFTVIVEFLDLKTSSLAGGELSSIWPSREMLQAFSSKSTLRCLSRMLEDGIRADVTIETSGGDLKAHKGILASCSPVFESMFLHDLREKQSSTIKIEDMSVESCIALLSCIYGSITPEDFWKHRPSLLDAANKYDMPDLKNLCEESLLEDINPGNVLERLHQAWLYQLRKLKKVCLTYLFDFGKIYDLKEEKSNFYRQACTWMSMMVMHMVIIHQEIYRVWLELR